MKRLLWIFLLLAGGLPLFAQTPDCVIAFNFNATGQRSAITGCGKNSQGVWEWRVIYANTGFTGPFSLRLESSQDGVTWATFAGTIQDGVNPNTATTKASTDMYGFNPYVSVALNAAAGAGTVSGVLYGCRQPGCSSAAATVTIPTPVPVDGPTAAGSPPTTPPVLVAGQDGAPGNIRTIKTDSVGELIPSNASEAAADTVSNTQLAPTGAAGGTLYQRAFQFVFDGATWDRMHGNTLGAFSQGSTADAAPLIANAVPIGGRDMGGDVRTGLFDGNGGFAPAAASSANPDGISNTQFGPTDGLANPLYTRNLPYKFNGTTWDKDFACTLQAPITISAASDAVIITGVAATRTRICHISWSSGATTADVTIRQGTGTTCGTNTATLAGVYYGVNSKDLDFTPEAALRTTVDARDVCIHTAPAVTMGGVVIYAQFN